MAEQTITINPEMRTRAKLSIMNAQALYETVEQRKALEKREKELKLYFTNLLPRGGIMRIGLLRLVVSPKQKRTLVRELVAKLIGEEKAKECERVTPYLEVSIHDASELQ